MVNLYERVLAHVESDVLEIFGDSGTGKSTFAYLVALHALEKGKAVWWLDTERNLSSSMVQKLQSFENFSYSYTPIFYEVVQRVRNLPKADLYVLDSIGFPALTEFAVVDMHRRGDILLKCIAVMSFIKQACYRNNALAVVTNQPISEFGKSNVAEDQLRPFGDKAIFATKCVWRTHLIETKPDLTVVEIRAWRDRRHGRGKTLYRLKISNSVEVEVVE
jgi:RecA/RadA recombinase